MDMAENLGLKRQLVDPLKKSPATDILPFVVVGNQVARAFGWSVGDQHIAVRSVRNFPVLPVGV